MKKLRKEDIRQEVFDLYDAYAHNQIGRREFLDKLSTYAVGGVTVMVTGIIKQIWPHRIEESRADADYVIEHLSELLVDN